MKTLAVALLTFSIFASSLSAADHSPRKHASAHPKKTAHVAKKHAKSTKHAGHKKARKHVAHVRR